MKEGILLFNEEKFWECHEVFEDVWAEDAHDPVRYIYWAIIQVAASLIHFRNKNLTGAQGMIAKAKEKFRKARELHILSELVFTYLDWDEFESLVMAIPEAKESKLSDFAPLFSFKFRHYPEKEF